MSKKIDSFQNYYWQLQILLKMDIGAYMYVLQKRMSEVINFFKYYYWYLQVYATCDIYCVNKLVLLIYKPILLKIDIHVERCMMYV